MKSSRPFTTVGELREKRKERKGIVAALLVLLIAIGGISLLVILIFSPNTDKLYHTAFSGIDYRLLSVTVMLTLGILFTGICILLADKRIGWKGFLKIFLYSLVAGIVCHTLVISLLLNLNLWMADGQTYEKEYQITEVRTQEPSQSGYSRYSLHFLLPDLKELKVADPDAPGKFLYFHVRPDSAIDTGDKLKVTLRNGIFGWKVVEEVGKVWTYEVRDGVIQE